MSAFKQVFEKTPKVKKWEFRTETELLYFLKLLADDIDL